MDKKLTEETEREQKYCELLREEVTKLAEKIGRIPTCHVSTFGCQMNARDSEKLLGILL